MPRSIPVPKVTYEQSEASDTTSIDAVFDKLFALLLKHEAEKRGLTRTRQPPTITYNHL